MVETRTLNREDSPMTKKTEHKISRNLNVGDCRWNSGRMEHRPDRITRVLRVTDCQEKVLYLRLIKKEEYSESRKKIFTQHNLEDM
jgi:hypothetical protein